MHFVEIQQRDCAPVVAVAVEIPVQGSFEAVGCKVRTLPGLACAVVINQRARKHRHQHFAVDCRLHYALAESMTCDSPHMSAFAYHKMVGLLVAALPLFKPCVNFCQIQQQVRIKSAHAVFPVDAFPAFPGGCV